MTVSIVEFADIEERSGAPLFPELHRQMGKGLSQFHQISDKNARVFRVHNDDGTTAVHVRVVLDNSAGNEAAQTDIHIAANSYETFHIHRGSRPFVYAVADT